MTNFLIRAKPFTSYKHCYEQLINDINQPTATYVFRKIKIKEAWRCVNVKKEMIMVFSCLALLAGCGGNKDISLEGDWVKKHGLVHGKSDDTDRCTSEYDIVKFSSKTVVMDDTEYSYQMESQEDFATKTVLMDDTVDAYLIESQEDEIINLKLIDNYTDEVKYYTIKKLKNGNIAMQQVDFPTGCELEKTN